MVVMVMKMGIIAINPYKAFYEMPGTVLCPLHVIPHLFFTTSEGAPVITFSLHRNFAEVK